MPNKARIEIEVDASGKVRATVKDIDGLVDKLGRTGEATGHKLDTAFGVFSGEIIADFFREGLREAEHFASESIKKFNELKLSQLALRSTAGFFGFSPDEAERSVQSLNGFRLGLLNAKEGARALQLLMSSSFKFSLQDSVQIVNGLTDAASLNRNMIYSVGQAVEYAAQGIKNKNLRQVEEAGITTSVNRILEQQGIKEADLNDKTKASAVSQALKVGLLKETAQFYGDAEKKAATFQGRMLQIDTIYLKLQQTFGKAIEENPEVLKGITDIGDKLAKALVEASTPGTKLNQTLTDFISLGGEAVQVGAKLIEFTTKWAGEIAALIKVAAGIGVVFALSKGTAAAGFVGGLLGKSPFGLNRAVREVEGEFGGGVAVGTRSGETVVAGQRISKEREAGDVLEKFNIAAKKSTGSLQEMEKKASSMWKDFASGGIGKVGNTALIVGPLVAALTEWITGAIREAKEKALGDISRTANLGLGEKDLTERRKELEQLRTLQPSEANGSQADINLRIAQTEKLLDLQRQLADFKKIGDSLTALRQGGATYAEVTKKLQETTRFQSLEALQDEIRKTELALKAGGGGSSDAITKMFQEIRIPGEETSKLVNEQMHRIHTAISASSKEFVDMLASLQSDTGNPYVAIFRKASKAQEEFEKKFGRLPESIQSVFEKVRTQELGVEIFKQDLTQIKGAAELQLEQQRLSVNRGFEQTREQRDIDLFEKLTAFDKQKKNLFAQSTIPTASDLARLADQFTGDSLSKAILSATAGLSPEEIRGEGLQYKIAYALDREKDRTQREADITNRKDQLQRDSLTDSLRKLDERAASEGELSIFKQTALTQAKLDEFKRLTDDQLSPEQRELKMRLISDKLAQDSALRQAAEKQEADRQSAQQDFINKLNTFTNSLPYELRIQVLDDTVNGVESTKILGHSKATSE